MQNIDETSLRPIAQKYTMKEAKSEMVSRTLSFETVTYFYF